MIRLALLAAMIGSALGAAYVFADAPEPRSVPAVATPTVSPAPQGGYNLTSSTAKKVVLQVSDPKGGAPWVMRTFIGQNVKQTLQCAEVDRLVDGHLGWIDHTGAFVAQTPLSTCDTAGFLRRFGAQVSRVVTVDAHDGFSRSVTWGHTAPDVSSLAPMGEPPVPVSGGVVLTVSATQLAAGPTGEIVYADGHRIPLHREQKPPFGGERAIVSTEAVGAVAPDPAGGLPWGMIAGRGEHGGRCAGLPGRLVGTQLGYLLGDVFSPESQASLFIRCNSGQLLDTLIAGGGEPDSVGRIERRVLDGRTILYGVLDPRIVSVTITTPSDVRTLVPTAQHGVLAVYQGTFPVGRLTATATFRDGHTITRRLESGGV